MTDDLQRMHSRRNERECCEWRAALCGAAAQAAERALDVRRGGGTCQSL